MAARTLEHFFSVLSSFQTPALTWYSEGGERVELSGRVLENWVSKTANFLVDECEIAAADTVTVAMETHWRTLVLVLASLRVGARIELAEEGPGLSGKRLGHRSQVVCAFDRHRVEGLAVDYPVLVDRGPLSTRFTGQLPDGALDYCALVPSCDDVYSQLAIPGDTDPVFVGSRISYARLLELAQRAADSYTAEGARSFYCPAPEYLTADYLVELLGLWSRQRGLLLLDPAYGWDSKTLDRVVTSEKAHTLP